MRFNHQKVKINCRLPKGVHKRLVQYSNRNGVSLNAAIIEAVETVTSKANQAVVQRAAELLAEALVRKASTGTVLSRTPEPLAETVRKLQHNQAVLEKMVAKVLQPTECRSQDTVQ